VPISVHRRLPGLPRTRPITPLKFAPPPARRLAYLFACLVTFLLFMSLSPSSIAAESTTPRPSGPPQQTSAIPTLTPDQARAALTVLLDPSRLAQVEGTLRALAAGNALSSIAAPASSQPAPSAAPAPLTRTLNANGLTSQLSRQAAHALLAVASQAKHSLTTLLDFRAARAWWTYYARSPQGYSELVSAAWMLAATFLPAFVLEWIAGLALGRPRQALAARDVGHDDAHDGGAMPAGLAASHGMGSVTPGLENIASSSPEAARAAQGKLRAVQNWALLRRLPGALLYAVVNLIPLGVFALSATAVMSLLTVDESPQDQAIGALIDVYVICRVVLSICAFFFAPDAPKLRMLRIGDHWATFAQRWARRLVATVGVGTAFVEAVLPFGLAVQSHSTITKIIALVVHGLVVALIVQVRRPVAAAIRTATSKRGSISHLGNWLADVWAGLTIFFVIALWVAWALGVHDGFAKVLHLGGLSIVILAVARVVGIVTFGALGQAFRHAEVNAHTSLARRRAYRYYPVLRRFVSWLLWLVTLASLLEVWGLDVARFFTQNALGHRLGLALITIAIAVAIAVLVWEVANAAAERRIDAWQSSGDRVRAARLHTLLPMLRTALFVAILLVVGLTALNEIGVNTAPLLASASIFGVALGFGSQKLVQDFITGIFLLMENAMQVGDWISVSGVSGKVEYLSIRTVRLRGLDGSLYTVPFSSVTTVNNSNRGIGNAAVKVTIAHGADVGRAIETLMEIGAELRAHDDFKNGILEDFSFWGVDQVDGANVTLVGQMQCTDAERWPVQREFNRRILDRFIERGIEIANPQRTFLVGAHFLADEARREGPRAGQDKKIELSME
ncbi:MAG: moderate conductance mechanosensitive channel, partial [Paraburkholderia sp.]|nr:moderate conductance mechanosensitive channel [Paraburkholderia sp.]